MTRLRPKRAGAGRTGRADFARSRVRRSRLGARTRASHKERAMCGIGDVEIGGTGCRDRAGQLTCLPGRTNDLWMLVALAAWEQPLQDGCLPCSSAPAK